jgi:hypothetical protein
MQEIVCFMIPFQHIQYQHNKLFLLLNDLFSNDSLLNFLLFFPDLVPLEKQIPFNSIESVLLYRLVGSRYHYELLFGTDGSNKANGGVDGSNSEDVGVKVSNTIASEIQTEHPNVTESSSVAINLDPCGHVFKKGESIYRCFDCGMDATCVLCTRCFRAGNHTGHSFSFSIASGSGGCCDCGDAEAWKIPCTCPWHNGTTRVHSTLLPNVFIHFMYRN